MKKVRVDKWLWAVRIFKSRTTATKACKASKVKISDLNVKPSYLLQGGETVIVKKNGFNLEFYVKELIEKRVSATLAAPCYENVTPESEMQKYQSWYIGKAAPEKREKGAGRPTKKERRELETFKDDIFDFEDEF